VVLRHLGSVMRYLQYLGQCVMHTVKVVMTASVSFLCSFEVYLSAFLFSTFPSGQRNTIQSRTIESLLCPSRIENEATASVSLHSPSLSLLSYPGLFLLFRRHNRIESPVSCAALITHWLYLLWSCQHKLSRLPPACTCDKPVKHTSRIKWTPLHTVIFS
jgi:hypothetical protein